MLSNCKDAMDNSPIIAAIKDMAGLKKCLTCDSQVIFILFGDICNIADIVDKVKTAGKTAMVHIDLINGLSGKEIAVDFTAIRWQCFFTNLGYRVYKKSLTRSCE